MLIEELVGSFQQATNAWISEAVIHQAAIPSVLHQPAPAQATEVAGNAALQPSDCVDKLASRGLRVHVQVLEDPDPGRVSESAEELGHPAGLVCLRPHQWIEARRLRHVVRY